MNRRVHILTDSASDMAATRPELTVLPMTVTFGDDAYLDGVTLTHRAFYEKLVESDALPTTSQIAPFDFEQAFRAAREAGEEVVAITISSKLSGTCQSARLAAEACGEGVYVVDSESASIGEHVLVEYALRLLGEGLPAAEIAAQLEARKRDIRVIALLDTLEYLVRGGRLSRTVGFVGGMLAIKPVIAIERGEVVVLGRARGSRNSNNLLTEQVSRSGGIDFSMPYTLGYTGLSDALLQKYIHDSAALWQAHADAGSLPCHTIGGTIGTHAGPGAIALAFFHC